MKIRKSDRVLFFAVILLVLTSHELWGQSESLVPLTHPKVNELTSRLQARGQWLSLNSEMLPYTESVIYSAPVDAGLQTLTGLDATNRWYTGNENSFSGCTGEFIKIYVGRFDNQWGIYNLPAVLIPFTVFAFMEANAPYDDHQNHRLSESTRWRNHDFNFHSEFIPNGAPCEFVLTGTVEKNNRPEADHFYSPCPNFWMKADLGLNLIQNQRHISEKYALRSLASFEVGLRYDLHFGLYYFPLTHPEGIEKSIIELC